jgi:CcmD family protein
MKIKFTIIMNKLLVIIALFFTSFISNAQEVTEKIEMADVMRSNGKIYVVVAIVAVIFTGIIVYLINLDGKISKIEKRIK